MAIVVILNYTYILTLNMHLVRVKSAILDD